MIIPAYAQSRCLAAIDVFVLAGGLGTRIRPVLGDVPKLLAPIGTRTYLDHLLQWLGRSGAHRIVFGLGVHAQAIARHLQQHPPVSFAIETLIEPAPLGTAGAIRFARSAFRSDPVMVMNGDTFADVDLCRMLDRHRTSGAAATILCATVENAGRYGRLAMDEDGFIESFVEKDATFSGRAPINAGVYFLSSHLLDTVAASDGPSLERDVFETLPRRSLAAFPECGRFIDIGTPESLALAGEFFDTTFRTPSSR